MSKPPEMKVRIFEVFTSIEGEGLLYGTKTLFVRLAGCPFTCFYCDTPEALPANSGTEYEIGDACSLIDSVLQDCTYKVNFTGGEPLVQYKAVAELARHVRSVGIRTYLESACYDSARFSHVMEHMDILKIEFKTADSKVGKDDAHYDRLVSEAAKCLKAATDSKKTAYVKIVVSSKTTEPEFVALLKKVSEAAAPESVSGFFIQPTTGVAEPRLEPLVRFYDLASKYYDEVRIVPQLHKLMGAI